MNSANSIKKAVLIYKGGEVENSNPATPTEKQPLKAVFSVLNQNGKKTGNNRKWLNSFTMKQTPYKLPKIRNYSDKDWYIEFSYEYPDQPGKFKLFKVRDGINYIKDLEEKTKAAEELRDNIEYALTHMGFTPFTQEKAEAIIVKEEVKIKKAEDLKNTFWTISKAVEEYRFVVTKKELAKTTLDNYNKYLNLFLDWSIKNELHDTHICAITEKDINLFLEWSETNSKEGQWKARTYNNYVKFYNGFFDRCYKMESKIHEVKYKIDFENIVIKKDRAEKNRYYNDRIAALVKHELNQPGNEYLNIYCEWLYYSCMRPNEVRFLKIEHIDIASRQIRVTAATGKTLNRFVPISDEFLSLIQRMELTSYPLNYFVIGSEGPPSAKNFHENYFTKRFLKIKQKLGLDDNYTLYGWKHTRVVNLIKNGFLDREIMDLTGHKDTASFDKYKRELMANPDTKLIGKTLKF